MDNDREMTGMSIHFHPLGESICLLYLVASEIGILEHCHSKACSSSRLSQLVKYPGYVLRHPGLGILTARNTD